MVELLFPVVQVHPALSSNAQCVDSRGLLPKSAEISRGDVVMADRVGVRGAGGNPGRVLSLPVVCWK